MTIVVCLSQSTPFLTITTEVCCILKRVDGEELDIIASIAALIYTT